MHFNGFYCNKMLKCTKNDQKSRIEINMNDNNNENNCINSNINLSEFKLKIDKLIN